MRALQSARHSTLDHGAQTGLTHQLRTVVCAFTCAYCVCACMLRVCMSTWVSVLVYESDVYVCACGGLSVSVSAYGSVRVCVCVCVCMNNAWTQ